MAAQRIQSSGASLGTIMMTVTQLNKSLSMCITLLYDSRLPFWT